MQETESKSDDSKLKHHQNHNINTQSGPYMDIFFGMRTDRTDRSFMTFKSKQSLATKHIPNLTHTFMKPTLTVLSSAQVMTKSWS
ncbi:hypothetical protein PRUPE_1G078500 [Prunus persica]|uniref:Uncharacterized protein n=1 Tax=Prunus persica TaxID=3760 RepID=A0A251QU06_PRUPE|nr:hypothetical protein PRUPE_1G078500 [Prunus persica]